MDRISQLSDELLLKILSLLPTVNEVVATMVLSKRWQFLWTMVPKLIYDDSYKKIEYARFSRFVDRSLCLHDAPVIETLHFKLGKSCGPDDIRVWIRAADKRCLRELILESNISSKASRFILPRSFYTGCRMLVTLNLSYAILADFSSPISFPFLKKLRLLSVKYPGDEFFSSFLSKCPVLEDLDLEKCRNDNVSICTVRVPSLKILSLCKIKRNNNNDEEGFVINAPSLVRLEITDSTNGFCVIENEMPMIVTVDVDIPRSNLGKILGSVTSVKHLYLCLSTPEDAYPVGNIFHQLVSLNLCTCDKQWLNLLMRVLKDSPNLRDLILELYHGLQEPNSCWTKPSSVPDCLLSSLENVKWVDYEGVEEEKELVEYILRNGACLKKVTISSVSIESDKKLEMIKLLTMSIRRSPSCQLLFN